MSRGAGEVLKRVFFTRDKRELGKCGQELTKPTKPMLSAGLVTSISNSSALPQGPGSDCNQSWGYRGGTDLKLNKAKARRADWDKGTFQFLAESAACSSPVMSPPALLPRQQVARGAHSPLWQCERK